MAHVKYNYTEYEFREAVKASTSVRQVLSKLGIVPAGGNYATFALRAKEWGVDTSHFRRSTDVARSYVKTKETSEYLKRDLYVTSTFLRERLLRDGYFSRRCCDCKLDEWQGVLIPLELEHIDGNHTNNELSNLKLLCPNCHALTDTYRGKNVRKRMQQGIAFQKYANDNTNVTLANRSRFKRCDDCHNRVKWTKIRCDYCRERHKRRKNKCADCDKPCHNLASRCLRCSERRKSSHIPSESSVRDKLVELNWNFSAVGRHFNVSDNTIRKWCKKYEITKSNLT